MSNCGELEKLLGKDFIFFDGGMGSLLQAKGLVPGELPETWNLTHREEIISIHCGYLLHGANILKTNTFGANILKFPDPATLEEIISAGIANARKAVFQVEQGLVKTDFVLKGLSPEKRKHFVFLDIGPLGKLLRPLGDLDFEEALSIFKTTAITGIKTGVDGILIETMNDSYETKAAVLGVKEAFETLGTKPVPVFVTNVYDQNGQTLSGSSPLEMISLLEGLGVSALGINCSLGPKEMEKLIPVFSGFSQLPVIVNPNAGLPRSRDGKTVYDVTPEDFAEEMVKIALAGGNILGGCCGTTPEYIGKMINALEGIRFKNPVHKNFSMVSSGIKTVFIGQGEIYGKNPPVLIGERINPTGKKKFKEALRNNDIGYILEQGIIQENKGAHILDVNVGLPEIDEAAMMASVVKELQSVVNVPLQIDTSDIASMETGLRLYNGKALVNSVNGKQETMDAVFPLVKKYGGVVVALTLDENGIPDTALGRIKIAGKILAEAKKYGIEGKNIIIDPLAMAVSSDSNSPSVTLEAVKKITEELQLNTILGVSNISFGLPKRDFITSSFFSMALEDGLSSAIMNPDSLEMQKAYKCFCALKGFDSNCSGYISFVETLPDNSAAVSGNGCPIPGSKDYGGGEKIPYEQDSLQYYIIKGLKEKAGEKTRVLLEKEDSFAIINEVLIPSLDYVGKGFEEKKIYLPQLLMSADAAKAAFDIIKKNLALSGENKDPKGRIILATVKGDIHDIGKNIVKIILENYGYQVLDLGKDVPPETVLKACLENKIRLVGLSALMTTTVPAMEETIRLLRKEAPWCKVCVGGAVLTPEYAEMIGADFYGKDAMETVKYAKIVFGN